MRAIVTAPVATDLSNMNCVKIPGATNGLLQAWDCIDSITLASYNDPTLTFYTTRASIPNVLKPFLVQVLRSDSATQQMNVAYKRLADCGAADFFRVRASDSSISVKTKAAMVAGDKPVDWAEVHSWAGVTDGLGTI